MKSKDYYQCNIPCTEKVYVPSLSFASISVDEDAIKSRRQEAKMAELEANLTAAREITYRIADDKYRATLRVMSMATFRANNLVAFLNATETLLHNEKTPLLLSFDAINSDCAFLLMTSRRLQGMVEASLMPTLQNFQTLLQILGFQLGDFSHLERAPSRVDEPREREFLEQLSSLNQSSYIKPLVVNFTCQSEFQNETVNSTISVPLPEFSVYATITNYHFDAYAYYVMLRSRLFTVINSVDMATKKLSNAVNKTVTSFPTEVEVDLGGVKTTVSFNDMKQELEKYVQTVQRRLFDIKQETQRAFHNRIEHLNVDDAIVPITITEKLDEIITLTNRTMHVTIVQEVEEYKQLANLLSPKCEYESNNLKATFLESQDQVINRMTEMRDDVWRFINDTKRITQRYVTRNISLDKYAKQFDSICQRNLFSAYALATENLIRQKIVTIRRLKGHGKSLQELSARYVPTHNDTDVATTSGSDVFGDDAIKTSEDVIERMRGHVGRLEEAIGTEKSYLSNYAQGNVLNEEFFK